MKHILPTWLIPLNIFNIHGTCCCLDMHNKIKNKNFIKHFFCYSSRTIYDANVLIIWGYISLKYARLLPQYCAYLPHKRFILYINNCSHVPQNYQNLNANVNINTKLECGELDEANTRRIIKEARQCLRA